jgi:hypothetical protein
VCEWEAKERERELFPLSILHLTHALLMNVGLLKFYQEGTSLMRNSLLLQQLIYRRDHGRQGFRVGLDLFYHPTEEDVYFINGLYRRGKALPQFLEILHGVVGDTQLEYVQIYFHP